MKRSVLPCWKLSILYKSAFQRLAAAIVSVCFFAAAVSVPAVAIEAQGDNTIVLHEMGHFEEQYASAQEEAAITNAFQKEQVLMAAFLHRDYCRKNVEEYFAEAFRAYLLGKDFSETEPLTWAAMEMLSRTWEADT